jgi:septal ring factor EnvC (AmiA/AmiB activator)
MFSLSQQEKVAPQVGVAVIIGLIIGSGFSYFILSMSTPQPSDEHQQQIQELQNKIAELEAQLAQYNETKIKYQQQIQELQNKIAELEAQLAQYNKTKIEP